MFYESSLQIHTKLIYVNIFTKLGHTHSFTWGPYAAFHGMSLLCHIEVFVITAV
jgi:hypothetical protein